MLEYKAARHGRSFARIDRWLPSTRACSVCGVIGAAKALKVRGWTCPCGAVHDRDVNAARNILAAGLSGEQTTPVELMSDPDLSGRSAAKQEPTGNATQAA
jgi:putative transposase